MLVTSLNKKIDNDKRIKTVDLENINRRYLKIK